MLDLLVGAGDGDRLRVEVDVGDHVAMNRVLLVTAEQAFPAGHEQTGVVGAHSHHLADGLPVPADHGAADEAGVELQLMRLR
jgi:hypothetical protein